jgi:hypothetical protein
LFPVTGGPWDNIPNWYIQVVPFYLKSCFPWFQLYVVNHGPTILNWKFQKLKKS